MSGFESAIRNAIARAPDGRPQTRQRIYDAARASLTRNLARVEVPDADTRRATLELTIERIEEEWRAIAARRAAPAVPMRSEPSPALPTEPEMPEPPVPMEAASETIPSSTAASSAKEPDTLAPVTATELPERSMPLEEAVSETTVAPSSVETDTLAPSAPDVSVAELEVAEPVAAQSAVQQTPLPESGEASADERQESEVLTASSSPSGADNVGRDAALALGEPPADLAPFMPRVDETAPPVDASTPSDQPEIVRTTLDPALAEQLAARDDAMGVGAPPTEPSLTVASTAPAAPVTALADEADSPQSSTDLPIGQPVITDLASAPVEASSAIEAPGAVEATPASEASPAGAATVVPEIGPAVDAPAVRSMPGKTKGSARKSRKDRKATKRARADGAAARAPKRGRRGRWLARVVSLVLLVAAGAVGWQWLDRSGMLEEGEADRVVVTVERGGAAPTDGPEWTALLTRELAGAVEPVAGEDALRVTGPAEVGLDAEALAALGPDVSVSLLVRAVGEPGQVAVSCDFAGGGCGRLRFTLPREAEERVLTATVTGTEEARLVLDPGVGGETAAFDLLGVTARSR